MTAGMGRLRLDAVIGFQRLGRETHAALARGIAHGRAPTKTGRSQHWRRWGAERIAKQYLQRASTAKLHEEKSLEGVSKAALQALAGRYETLWDLCTANRSDMLELPAVGPATIKRLHTYLTGKNAPVAWEA